MEKSYYKSPIGILEIICENDALISLKLVKNTDKSSNETILIKEIRRQLSEYFSGERKVFDIKINPQGTKFQKLVWKELQKIQYGKTKSYSEIAATIGNKNAQRAIYHYYSNKKKYFWHYVFYALSYHLHYNKDQNYGTILHNDFYF